LFIGLFIFCNYYYLWQNRIHTFDTEHRFVIWFFIFLAAFSFGYILQAVVKKSGIFNNTTFLILLLLAPALFAWKMVYSIDLNLTADTYVNAYWNHVIYWPFKLLIITSVLWIVWRVFDRQQPFYGTGTRHFHPRPYWIMLLIMVPLVAAAATQPDFLNVYPKLKNISFLAQGGSWWHKLLFELSYGTDFISIELFFRGFLILAFAKWVGKDAILPMALFYCTIHFGKPLGECISSFFGGIILGVVTYHCRTIWGGLMVHLGIAWLMELGGYLGNLYLR
jgi:hypothetical protein